MSTAAGISYTPYLATVAPRICQCKLPARELARRRKMAPAIKLIEGYWNVYLGFFGDQVIWLDFLVIDLRDGRIVWRNGRQLVEEETHG